MHDIQIATIAELEREKLVGARLAGVELVAVHRSDGVTLYEGLCPHQGTLLSEGAVEDGRLICKELMRYTVDITTNLAFGYDMNTLEKEGDRIQRHIERIFPMIAYRS